MGCRHTVGGEVLVRPASLRYTRRRRPPCRQPEIGDGIPQTMFCYQSETAHQATPFELWYPSIPLAGSPRSSASHGPLSVQGPRGSTTCTPPHVAFPPWGLQLSGTI